MRQQYTTYRDDMPETAYRLLSEGATYAQIMSALKICRATFFQWINPESTAYRPAFHDAVQRGIVHAQAYWEERLAEAAIGRNKDANPTLLIFMLKNRFKDDWADVQRVEQRVTTTVESLSDEELEQIAAGGNRTAKAKKGAD